MITAAAHNTVYYDHIGDADAKNAAAAAARAGEEQVRSADGQGLVGWGLAGAFACEPGLVSEYDRVHAVA
jgi:hypothetical protein